MLVWRVSHVQYSAFDGEGSQRFNGRWHRAGVPLIYTSEHLSLAALEFFVNIDADEQHVVLAAGSAEIPDGVALDRLLVSDLPRDWRSSNFGLLRDRGMKWLEQRRTAVLVVPSVVIPQENNYLLNPMHPDFARIRVRKHQAFSFDPRMWK